MHDHLAAVSLTLFVYAALVLSYFGWGIAVARVLRLTTSNSVMLVWLGWAVALMIFQVLHLFLPLSTIVIAPVFLAGMALAIPRVILCARGLRFERGRMIYVAGVAMVIAVAAFWLVSRSMIEPRIYDTGLYHLNAIRWINTFPVVPGLGNLHGRLAFNQSFFTYAASLNVAPLLANGSRIANSFLFLLTAATFLARLRPVAARPSLLLEAHPFQYLPSLFVLPILAYLALSPALTAPTPDPATDLLQLVMFVTLAGVVRREGSPVMLAILAATAITIKLSNLAFSLVVLAIAFFLLRGKRNLLRAVVLVTVVLAVWVARGYVTSGMPLYPSTIGSVAFDWSVPRADAAYMTAMIRGWALGLHPWSPTLEHWTWVSAWFRRFVKSTIIAPFLLGVCLLGATGVIAALKKRRLREAVIVVPVLAGLVFWFLTAPDPRFAHSLFVCFGIAAALLLLTSIQSSISRRSFALLLCVTFAATHFGIALQTYRERETIGQISLAGWQPIPRSLVLPRTTASGMDVLTPAIGDKCWDAALPCTPYFRDDLRLRVPGQLGSGFTVAPPPPSLKATVLNLRSFGATGDGISDDGPALQRALDALAASGGGTLYVPPGSYAIATPVARGFSSKASAIAIAGKDSGTAIDVAGNGSGLNLTSAFIIKVGKAYVALALGGLESLTIRDIAFIGVQNVRDDAHVVLQVNGIERVRIEHCEFYGLASLTGGAIVAAYQSGLTIDRTAFLGCATNSAHSASMIQSQAWKTISITNTKFIDYGDRPDAYSKTPLGVPYSWIGIGGAEDVQATSFRRDAVIRNVFLDEGALFGITARPDLDPASSAPFNVFISAIRMNVSNLAASGIYLSGADKVLIEQSHLGWSHNADAAVILKDVDEAILDRLECVAHANTIRADGDTKRLVVINSTYQTLDSAAPYTKTITTPDDPVQLVRQTYRKILRADPDLHELHFWTDQILKCEGFAPCSVETRTALTKYLREAAARWRRD